MIAITLSIQTDDPDIVARATEVLGRAAAGLALEAGLDDGVNITILHFDPDSDSDDDG